MFSRIFEIVENLFFLIVRKIIEFEKCALIKYNIRKFPNFVFCHARIKRLGASHNKRNREQKIRISTYQKSCIVEYTVSDRLKSYSLFSVPYCAELLNIFTKSPDTYEEIAITIKITRFQLIGNCIFQCI